MNERNQQEKCACIITYAVAYRAQSYPAMKSEHRSMLRPNLYSNEFHFFLPILTSTRISFIVSSSCGTIVPYKFEIKSLFKHRFVHIYLFLSFSYHMDKEEIIFGFFYMYL